jgi:hypothetical protein
MDFQESQPETEREIYAEMAQNFNERFQELLKGSDLKATARAWEDWLHCSHDAYLMECVIAAKERKHR